MLIASEAPGGRGQNARLDCITLELCSAPDLVLGVCVCDILHQQSSDIVRHIHTKVCTHSHKLTHTNTHTSTHKHTH